MNSLGDKPDHRNEGGIDQVPETNFEVAYPGATQTRAGTTQFTTHFSRYSTWIGHAADDFDPKLSLASTAADSPHFNVWYTRDHLELWKVL